MKQLAIVICFLCIVQCPRLKAKEFDQAVINYVSEYSYSIDDGFVATIQGTFKNLLTKLKSFEDKAKPEDVKLKVLGMRKNFSAAKYFLHAKVTQVYHEVSSAPYGSQIIITDYKYKLKPAKVVFYIAGLFDDAGSGNSKSIINEYINLGYHVVAIANPLSQDFLQAEPTYEVGNVKAEAKVVLSVIEETLKDLKKRKLLYNNEVYLAGISHGAFIAAVAAALDSEKDHPLITKDVTIFSPPYNLLKAASYLDLACAETKEYYGLGFLKLGKRILDLLKIKNSDEIKEEQATFAKGVVSNVVFKKSMVESLTLYDKLTHRLNIPQKKEDQEKWNKNLTFFGYYQKYAPTSFKQLKSGDGAIKKWMDLYHRNTSQVVRVLTARDDFLNDRFDWGNLPLEQAIVLDYGGHMGFVSSKSWFKKFMQLAHR